MNTAGLAYEPGRVRGVAIKANAGTSSTTMGSVSALLYYMDMNCRECDIVEHGLWNGRSDYSVILEDGEAEAVRAIGFGGFLDKTMIPVDVFNDLMRAVMILKGSRHV